jgi:hypothetical protein
VIAATLMAVLFSSCAMMEHSAEQKRTSEERVAAWEVHQAWRSESGWRANTYRNEDLLARATAENASVEISLSEQRGFLLVDGGIALDFPVATGRSSHPTPTGEFRILGKERNYSSNLYGKIVDSAGVVLVENADCRTDLVPEGAVFEGARMPYWMRLTDTGVGMHIGYVPGRPASHGCIRLRRQTATRLFDLLQIGSLVTIADKAPAMEPPTR